MSDGLPGALLICAAMLVIGICLGQWIGSDGYQNGQIDAINGTWKYQKVTTSDGAVHYLAVATQPAK